MKPEEAVTQMVVQLGWKEVGVGVLLLAVLQFLAGLWLKARLESSIKYEFDRRLKDYEHELKIRDQAARVAELFAIAFDSKTESMRFNQLVWELSLWLPASLVCELAECLVGTKKAKTPMEILIEVRRTLLQSPKDP